MNEPPPIVLVIEDEDQIRRFVRTTLESEGFTVVEAETIERGLTAAGAHKPDLVLLDLGLPDGDGVDFIRNLRTWSEIPVIVLSARAGESDKIRALDAGADDYLTKPFGTGELLARTRAHLRRRAHVGESGRTDVTFGQVHVDLVRHTITRAGQPIELTPLEYRLLALLIFHAGKVLTHQQIVREVWGPSPVDRSTHLRVYIDCLRRKLEANPAQPEHIVTETGVGYRFIL